MHDPAKPGSGNNSPPIKIWVMFAATGRSTGLTLTSDEVDNLTTVGALANVLTSPAHVGRLRQLGFSGVAISLIAKDGVERELGHQISRGVLENFTEQTSPLVFELSKTPAVPLSGVPTEAGASRSSLQVTVAPSPEVASEGRTALSPGSPTQGRFLSPAERAHRAEVERLALAARNSTRPEPAYLPGEVVPEVQRDMLSHLKKSCPPPCKVPTPASPVTEKEEEEEEKKKGEEEGEEEDLTTHPAFLAPASVPKFEAPGTQTVDRSLQRQLRAQLAGFTNKYACKDRAALLKFMPSMLVFPFLR